MNDHELDEQSYKQFRKVLKFVTYIVLFSGIVIFSFLSLASFVMAVTNIQSPDVSEYPPGLYGTYNESFQVIYDSVDELDKVANNKTLPKELRDLIAILFVSASLFLFVWYCFVLCLLCIVFALYCF